MLARNTSEIEPWPRRVSGRLTSRRVGNRFDVERVNPEFDETLRPSEALDSDEVRNDDGDQVVDPPEHWAAADRVAEEPDGESLDEKLAAEEPESAPVAASDDDLDHIDPTRHGTDKGQVSGTPEDGDSLFGVVE